jgi:hypothetical protein
MKLASYGLIVLGIAVAVLGLVNHYVLKPPINVVQHTSTVLIAAGAVVLVIGGALMLMGRGSAS